MKAILVLTAAVTVALAVPAEARTKGLAPHAHKTPVHASGPHKLRAPKSSFKTVRVRRADGTVMTGYRDQLGTHLRGSDGRTIHCQRQIGAADIDVACR